MKEGQHKSLAKSLYFQSSPTLKLGEIADKVGIKLNTLKHWVYRGSSGEMPWSNLKSLNTEDQLSEILESGSTKLSDIYNLGLAVVQRSLASMELDKVILTEQGVDRLLTALDKIDRWQRLEEAKKELKIDDDFELAQSEQDIMESLFKEDSE